MGKSYRELEYEIEGNLEKIARLKDELAKLKRDYQILTAYYECALSENNKLKDKLVEAGQNIAKLEGQLDRTKNVVRILSGRENW